MNLMNVNEYKTFFFVHTNYDINKLYLGSNDNKSFIRK